jgi:hypothetical protein
MKTLAMYLPQFHRVAENDKWWGEGFTEWTAVKKASPIFEGHKQPRVPLKDNYYDLMQKSTMQWQADLAQLYKVYGFCFYHYWFKEGRKILEKPAENLLIWEDININFCFCWANESWARSWSNLVHKNTWANKFENSSELSTEDNGILLEQNYGKEQDWKKHFEYLLPFFKDKRYIKNEGKPIFLIYNPEQIICLDDMMEKWNQWASEEGFEGIYVIAVNALANKWNSVDAYLVHEPAHIRSVFGNNLLDEKFNSNDKNRVFSYDKTWAAILNSEYKSHSKTYIGGFVDYDDTPRRGKMGSCYSGVTADKFKYYFEKLVVKNLEMNNDLVFLNAWNEWGEGMYLEPDEDKKYQFLEAIKEVMEKYYDNKIKDMHYKVDSHVNGSSSELTADSSTENQMDEKYVQLVKYKEYFDLANRWLYLMEANKTLKDFFAYNNYNKIAIYGMGDFGKHLFEELKDTEIQVEYCIDKGIRNYKKGVQIVDPTESLSTVDAIIVTPIMEYQTIKEDLEKKINCPIISLKQVIYEL